MRHYPSVRKGNLMVSRAPASSHTWPSVPPEMCLVLYAALHRRAHVLVENPTLSLAAWHRSAFPSKAEIFEHPRLRALLDLRNFHECRTWLGAFGAKTWKPVRLVSSDPAVQLLRRIGLRLKLSSCAVCQEARQIEVCAEHFNHKVLGFGWQTEIPGRRKAPKRDSSVSSPLWESSA